jgi:FtsH-binding integral membrane protein
MKAENDRNKEVLGAAVMLTLFLALTAPKNPDRPHWVATYFYSIAVWLILNMFLLSKFNSSELLVINIIIAVVLVIIWIALIQYDLAVVNKERTTLRKQCEQQGVAYEDPYAPHCPRRIFLYLCVLFSYTTISQTDITLLLCLKIFAGFCVVYAIRDELYQDKTEANNRG